MPELAHEIPSQDELKAYLQEHVDGSMFAPFWMSPEQLFHWFLPETARAFITTSDMDGRAFALLAFDAILAGLSRMNSLPRNHPFWQNTNFRPTIYKLPGFCRMQLMRAPHDPEVLWAAAIIPVWFGRNDFGQASWLDLSRQPGFDVRWPIYAALTTHLTAQFTEEQVSHFLRDAGLTLEAIPILRRIAAESDGTSVPWANRVLQLLEAGGED
jgi:hypothetical protein